MLSSLAKQKNFVMHGDVVEYWKSCGLFQKVLRAPAQLICLWCLPPCDRRQQVRAGFPYLYWLPLVTSNKLYANNEVAILSWLTLWMHTWTWHFVFCKILFCHNGNITWNLLDRWVDIFFFLWCQIFYALFSLLSHIQSNDPEKFQNDENNPIENLPVLCQCMTGV